MKGKLQIWNTYFMVSILRDYFKRRNWILRWKEKIVRLKAKKVLENVVKKFIKKE